MTGGGGIMPDFVVYPPGMNRLRSGAARPAASFTNFATEYLRSHKVTDDFEVTPAMLDEFQAFARRARGIQPGAGRMGRASATSSAIALKTEIFNQAFGVEKGDEVEAQRDPADSESSWSSSSRRQ